MPHNAVLEAPRRATLPLIVLAQFAGTSLWFVGNAALGDLQHLWPAVDGALGWLTSAVQLGFIVGTVLFGVLGVADRFASHRVFLACALGGAVANALSMLDPASFPAFVASRFVTGVCLAGIYPVGMKLAASWYRAGLGAAIGFLVGALVLGTAFPHLLSSLHLGPQTLVFAASGLAVAGGVAVGLGVPEGPHVSRARRARMHDALKVFRVPDFRAAALGYFGHMWELYAFWAFVPFAVSLALGDAYPGWSRPLAAFGVIAAGSVACVVGGLLSRRFGSAAVAGVQLVGSGCCVAISPWVLGQAPPWLGYGFLLLWGALVVGDSPQFSAIAARSAPADRVGTGLTLMNAAGFAITIPAIALLTALASCVEARWLLLGLLPGPVLGAVSLARVWRSDPTLR